jgi:magnesium-transporting ATPase (P-type)
MPTKQWHQLTVDECLNILDSDKTGLNHSQAKKRLTQHGKNELPKIDPPNNLLLILNQFSNPLVYILLIVVFLTVLLKHYIDSFVILFIVLTNAIIGFYQEKKAQNSLEKLQSFLIPKAKVLRENEPHEITSDLLVLGDIILIEAGSKIPADLRLIETVDIRIDEAVLTGESIPVEKKSTPIKNSHSIADRKNIAYSGTYVTSGRGRGVVIATGSETEFGQIASSLIQADPPPSPLQVELKKLSTDLLILMSVTIILLIALGLFRQLRFIDIIFAAVNLAVSVIPEGLPAVLTITLTLGVRRIAQKNAVIKFLPTIETLGAINLVATDKTGTLTKDEMAVQKIYIYPNIFEVTASGYTPSGDFFLEKKKISPLSYIALKKILTMGVLCSDTDLVEENGKWEIVGDPTEGAIITAAAKAGITKPGIEEKFERIDEIPFHTAKRFMATLDKDEDGSRVIAIKGASEKILTYCNTYYQNNYRLKFTAKAREQFEEINRQFAKDGFRVLAVACKEVEKDKEKIIEKDLSGSTLIGFFAMQDAPREEAYRAIKQAHKAGIRVVMVTGDHALTAQHIAEQLLISNQKIVLQGEELDKMSGNQLKKATQICNVYARIAPLNKLSLVQYFQKHGHLVAVTGDGINDSAALKQADVGIAMGKTGTDVSREAASMVLINDNFSTIIKAIEEGRTVYQNIKRVILYLLSTNIGELMVVMTSLIIGLPLPVVPIQLLWINLITDGFATIPLSIEPKHQNVMNRPPRDLKTPLLDNLLKFRIIYVSIVMTIGTLSLFSYELNHASQEQARSVAFATMILFQIFNMLNCRSLNTTILKKLPYNPALTISFLAACIVTFFAIYMPFLQKIFYTTDLTGAQWIRVVLVSLTIILAVEIEKQVRHVYKNTNSFKFKLFERKEIL